jgi:asparagine synthase (glutamine-hydrolysing)
MKLHRIRWGQGYSPMSAIFGLLHRDGRPIDPAHLPKMSTALTPHGPNHYGFVTEVDAGLGYRLSRFTPEDQFEAQPLRDEHSGIRLVSDARLDNRPELAEQLGIRAPEAAGMPDSAFILLAWKRWGPDCVRRLIGAYALAVYDTRERSLFLARSPRGERPLHYLLTPEVLAFSTAPKGLFALPFINRQLNLSRVADYLLTRPYDREATFYSGILSLVPGHTLVVSRESARINRFRDVADLPPVRFRRDEEYVEAFSALFDRVVADSLRSRSPIGIMLSGGLDSTAVAASAALALQRSGRRLSAFTEVPEGASKIPVVTGRYFDETPYVEAMARRYPAIDTTWVRTPNQFFLEGIDRFFEAAEVPFRNASNRVWIDAIQQQAAGRDIRVLLTGQGGNLTISWGGSDLLPGLLVRGRLFRALLEARALAREGVSASATRALFSGVLPLISDSLWLGIHRLRHPTDQFYSRESPWQAYSPIGRDLFSDMKLAERVREQGQNWQLRPKPGARVRTLEINSLGPDIRSGQEALHAVQMRSPAEDQRIVEFCVSIPEDQFLRSGVDRWLVRRAMATRLPKEILANRSRGLQAADWGQRLARAAPRVLEEIDLLQRCELAAYAIDLKGLRLVIQETISAPSGPGPLSLRRRSKIEAGLMTGRFLRWFASGN